MSRVRWSTTAADDLESITNYVRKNSPSAALRIARTIHGAIAELRRFPRRGRIGFDSDTRELLFPPWPYIAVYEIIDDQVVVLRIRHAAQNLQ